MAGRRVLAPLVKVRILVPQPADNKGLPYLAVIPCLFFRFVSLSRFFSQDMILNTKGSTNTPGIANKYGFWYSGK